MQVIEERMTAKTGNPATCEDRFCVTEHYACVVDGATDVSGKRYGGLTPGQVVSGVIADTIPLLPPDAGIEEIIGTINERLIAYYKANDMYDSVCENPFSRPSASMALYSRARRSVWLVGDCQCMIDGTAHTNSKTVDDITAAARSLFLEAELQQGKTVEQLLERDTGFEAVRPFIRMQYYLQNTDQESPYGYVAITGFRFDLNRIKTVPVTADARQLALASDGYPRIMPTLEQSERELERLLRADPLCFREYKLAKGLTAGNVSFDDRTYVRLALSLPSH